MIKRNLISFAALGVFAVFAAGSTPDLIEQIKNAAGGGGENNVSACKAYVEHHNSQPCLKAAQLDPDQMCNGLDATPIEMSGYYDCMRNGTKCNGDIPDLSALSNCSM